MEKVNIRLDCFEGPMELLIHLIEKNKIDIYDIPIAILTDQYIESINNGIYKEMETMSGFLVMAATLLEIKSKTLIPRQKDEKEEDDPRQELVERIVEYKRFKKAAEIFADIEEISGIKVFKKPDNYLLNLLKTNDKNDIEEVLNGITLDMLYGAFEDVLKRQEKKRDKLRSGFNSVYREVFTIDDKITYIKDLLVINKELRFSVFFESAVSKSEIVVTFLAMLELIKAREITVWQENTFDDIIIMENIT